MATILQFPVKNVIPIWGLTRDECEAVHAEAYDLMLRGRATGICVQEDEPYMGVFDGDGQPYFIGRENGVCYLLDSHEMILARSRRFEIVLDALDMMLSPEPDQPA